MPGPGRADRWAGAVSASTRYMEEPCGKTSCTTPVPAGKRARLRAVAGVCPAPLTFATDFFGREFRVCALTQSVMRSPVLPGVREDPLEVGCPRHRQPLAPV